MSDSNKYRISLHVSHADLSADEIISTIPHPVRYSKSSGELRKTKEGRLLGGVYKKTNVSFDVSNGVKLNDDLLLPQCIINVLDNITLRIIDKFIESGGDCFFMVGIYSEGNMLCTFDSNILGILAEHKIGMKLDFYGGPENIDNS